MVKDQETESNSAFSYINNLNKRRECMVRFEKYLSGGNVRMGYALRSI